jgi:hypothetical protein
MIAASGSKRVGAAREVGITIKMGSQVFGIVTDESAKGVLKCPINVTHEPM